MRMTRQEFLKTLLAATAMPWVAPARADQGGPIVVGATVPMTGPLSLTGKQYHNSGGILPMLMSVTISPGVMQLTRMLSGPSSRAIALARPSTPALAAE